MTISCYASYVLQFIKKHLLEIKPFCCICYVAHKTRAKYQDTVIVL
jgi:hypothetical protein